MDCVLDVVRGPLGEVMCSLGRPAMLESRRLWIREDQRQTSQGPFRIFEILEEPFCQRPRRYRRRIELAHALGYFGVLVRASHKIWILADADDQNVRSGT